MTIHGATSVRKAGKIPGVSPGERTVVRRWEGVARGSQGSGMGRGCL